MLILTHPPEHFEVLEGYARFQPTGEFTVPEFVDLISKAVDYTREHEIPRLLVNITQVTGVPPLTVTQRYYFMREWASHARGVRKIAGVIRPERLDPQRFGVTTAFNAGLNYNVFASESEALAWLFAKE